MKVGANEVKSRESSHPNEGQLASSALLGLEGNSSSGRKPLSPSDTSIDESVKSAHGKEVKRNEYFNRAKASSVVNLINLYERNFRLWNRTH